MIRLSAFADEIDADPVAQLDVLGEHDIKFIEFRSIYGVNVLDLDDARHEAFRALLIGRGVGLSAIGSPVGKVPITDPFEPHLERLARALDLAELYGTDRVRVFSFYMPPGDDPATHRDEVIRRMSTLADRALRRGVTLVLENERQVYGDTAERVLDVLNAVHMPSLGHAFDPANYLEVGDDVDAAWSLLRGRMVHFHVKDYSKALKKNVPAGEGDGQIPRLLAEADADGYSGFAVLEPHLVVAAQSHGYTGPERFGDAARALKGVLDYHNINYI